MQATQVSTTPSYQSYESTIYTPFSSDAPYSDANSGDNGPSRITNRKNGFVDPGEHGKEESPIGDAWSLLVFAALAAGVVYIKRRSATKKSRSC